MMIALKKRTEMPEHITNLIEYMCGNTSVNPINRRQPSYFWSVGN